MPITTVTGDLFTIPDLDALAHGCNCAGAMGRGIAVEFRRRWPEMFRDYRVRCELGSFVPGAVFASRILRPTPWRVIFNLATQQHWRGPGARASLRAIETSVREMLSLCERNPRWGVKRIGMPLIGCGLGGLDWTRDVEPVVRREAESSPIQLVVVVRSAADIE